MRQITCSTLCLLLILCMGTAHASVLQDPGGQPPPALEARMVQLFEQERYEEAARLIRSFLEDSPNHPTMLYNLACAYARMEQADEAIETIERAIKAGFADLSHMRRDPDLASIHDHPRFRELIRIHREAMANMAERQLESARAFFGESYTYDTDESRRLHFAIALDDVSYREMRTMLERQADQMIRSLFEAPPEYFTLVVIPTHEHAQQIFAEPNFGGIYQHAQRRLVARDIGTMLRHEFVHLMHYGHMERLNQQHPMWIQEGIASLYELYEFNDNGDIVFLPNERHNLARRLAVSGMTIQQLIELPNTRFMARAEANYAHVRSIFEFLADQDKLETWYRTYVELYDEDRTGRLAFEQVFEGTMRDVERTWRAWVRERPIVEMRMRDGRGSLGIDVDEHGANDGVMISRVTRGSGAFRAGLQVGDVIVGINDRTIRSYRELLGVIADMDPGDVVRIRFRRGQRYETVPVILSPLRLP